MNQAFLYMLNRALSTYYNNIVNINIVRLVVIVRHRNTKEVVVTC